MFTMFND